MKNLYVWIIKFVVTACLYTASPVRAYDDASFNVSIKWAYSTATLCLTLVGNDVYLISALTNDQEEALVIDIGHNGLNGELYSNPYTVYLKDKEIRPIASGAEDDLSGSDIYVLKPNEVYFGFINLSSHYSISKFDVENLKIDFSLYVKPRSREFDVVNFKKEGIEYSERCKF